jgi:hypothetical protein
MSAGQVSAHTHLVIWTAPPSRGSLFLEWVAALLLGIVDSYAPGPKAPPRIRQIIEPREGGAVQKRRPPI